jgi:hypothetical protein
MPHFELHLRHNVVTLLFYCHYAAVTQFVQSCYTLILAAFSVTCPTLNCTYSGVTVVLQWCYNNVTMVSQWCYNPTRSIQCNIPHFKLHIHWCFTVVTLCLHCCHTILTHLLHLCYTIILAAFSVTWLTTDCTYERQHRLCCQREMVRVLERNTVTE